MLRESCIATETPVDLAAVTDPRRDPLVPGGRALVRLADAAVAGEEGQLDEARGEAVAELGWDAFVDAAAVIATFEMMNRVGDATGIRVGRGRLASTAEVRELAGIREPRHG